MWNLLTAKFVIEPLSTIIGTTDVRINASLHERLNATAKPATNMVICWQASGTLSLIPSWTSRVSDVMRVATSPAPTLSKNATGCLRTAFR